MAEDGGSVGLLVGVWIKRDGMEVVPLLLVGFCELDLHSVDAVYTVNEED